MDTTSFDFEKPIADLNQEIEKVKQIAEKTKVNMSDKVKELEIKLEKTKIEVYQNLSRWQEV